MGERELINLVNENYKAAKVMLTSKIQGYAGVIRTALESAVKLFWLKKYGKEPVWIIGGREQFNLNEAINDIKFSSCFNQIILTDMNLIRKMCNSALHSGDISLTLSDAQELLERLEKCLNAISNAIGLELISVAQTSNTTVHSKETPKITPIKTPTGKKAITEKMRDCIWDVFIKNKNASYSEYQQLAKGISESTGMNPSSAKIYLVILFCFFHGKFNTRLMKLSDVNYYVKRISQECTKTELASTLQSLESSIPYWQEHNFGDFAIKVQNLVNQYKTFI